LYCWSLLGVPRNATQAQIKAAYYKQSFVYHPDRNAGSEQAAERFTRIHEAYLVLSSVTLRKRYDRGLLSGEELRAASGSSGQASAAPPKPSEAPRRSQAFTAGRMPQKPIFDFDKFYKAHYGEQLERERLLRERLRQRKGQMESFTKEEQETYQPYIVVCLIATGVLLLYSME
uniref:DnaJ homolog subfamily C member 30, mitochondrial n=1 Tax=Salvator merianae TaxID=96440 RepID=A0A8D0BX36_SALMN